MRDMKTSFFRKGKRKLNNLSIPDIIECPRVYKGYPTEKPVDVSKVLIEQSSSEGEMVADPFFGSCSVGVAACELGRYFIGNDINDSAIELARTRLQEHMISSKEEETADTDEETELTPQLSLSLA